MLLALTLVIATAKIGGWLSNRLGQRAGQHGIRDDLPLFPSLEDLLRSREEQHRTLFAVVLDGFDVEALVTATEKITRPLDEPDTGIRFVVPVTRAWGLHRGGVSE